MDPCHWVLANMVCLLVCTLSSLVGAEGWLQYTVCMLRMYAYVCILCMTNMYVCIHHRWQEQHRHSGRQEDYLHCHSQVVTFACEVKGVAVLQLMVSQLQ